MRYALRKQDKIAAAIGDDYLKNHILKVLIVSSERAMMNV